MLKLVYISLAAKGSNILAKRVAAFCIINMKDIEGFEGLYAVTEDGKVWSYPKSGGTLNGKWLTHFDHRKGYKVVYLSKNKITKGVFVHRLVAKTYIKNPLNKKEVNHIDGNKTNNCVENLEWATRQENMNHAKESGLLKKCARRGTDHHESKLDWDKVSEIRKLYKTGKWKQRDLGKKYGVNQKAIWLVIHNQTWITPAHTHKQVV